jgi:hypothetical protein
MASLIYPAATSSGSTTNTTYWTIPVQKKQYKSAVTYAPGIYQITTYPTSTDAYVDFYNSSDELILSTVTVSGTVSVNLASSPAYMIVYTYGSDNCLVGITLTGGNGTYSSNLSGTLDTITASGTYNQTGLMYVMVVGAGGGGGGAGSNTYGYPAGGAGGLDAKLLTVNTATSVTVGARGNSNGNGNGNAGGATSFGNYLTANGGGSKNGGTPRGGIGGAGYSGEGPPTETINLWNSVKSGTNGGGGADGGGNRGTGVGSGIGTGGNIGGSATGYGAGGGGGGYGGVGGNGTQGVVYVLRGLTWNA